MPKTTQPDYIVVAARGYIQSEADDIKRLFEAKKVRIVVKFIFID